MYLNEEEYTSWSAGLDFIIFSKTSFVNVLGFKSNPICKNISYIHNCLAFNFLKRLIKKISIFKH